jgi:Ni/Co efflux regulator RcnB
MAIPSCYEEWPMNRTILAGFAATIMLAAIAAPAQEIGVQVGFSDGDISTIRAYYRDHAQPAKSGKDKSRSGAKGLPPGIEKNLQQGKPLPPGIAKKALPSDLLEMLSPPPKGFERIEMAGKILLVEIATQVIHDVLEDVVFGS